MGHNFTVLSQSMHTVNGTITFKIIFDVEFNIYFHFCSYHFHSPSQKRSHKLTSKILDFTRLDIFSKKSVSKPKSKISNTTFGTLSK